MKTCFSLIHATDTFLVSFYATTFMMTPIPSPLSALVAV